MSRIAKKPIIIPESISVKIEGKKIFLKRKKLQVFKVIHKSVVPVLENKKLFFKVKNNLKKNKMYVGTTRSIIFNIINGMMYGYTKILLIVGVGYKAIVENNILSLSLGFSHIIHYNIPLNINIKCSDANEIIITGWDKQLVGCVAATIRSFRPPEHYKKGKGIRYVNEKVRIKEHKKKLSK